MIPEDKSTYGLENNPPATKTINTKRRMLVRKNKNLVRVCQSETPPKTLDPMIFDNKLHEITFHIFDRLVMWDARGQIVPGLALHWKRLNNTTFQLKLRKGIKFHNGEPFNANSVRFTINRLIHPESEEQGNPLLSTLSRVDIIDPYTINIITNKPDYLLIRKLSLVQILPEKYFNSVGLEKFGRSPIGTGAYKFEKWDSDGSLVLVKNDNYWIPDTPHIKRVIFKFIKVDKISRKEQLDALFEGKVDLITELPGLHSLRVQKNIKTKVIKFPKCAKVHKMVFNSQKAPFNDARARKAVNLSLNRDVLIKVLAKGNGRKLATNSVEIEFGHNPELKPYPYDLRLARKLLEQAGYKNKQLPIKIAVTDETTLIAQAVKKDLETINLKAQIDVMTGSEMARKLITAKSDPKQKWNYDMTIYSGVDPLLHVGFLYGLALYSKGSFSTTTNPEVDSIFEKLLITYDEKEQQQLSYKLEELSHSNYWYTPVFQVIITYGAAKDLILEDSATSFVDLTKARYLDTGK